MNFKPKHIVPFIILFISLIITSCVEYRVIGIQTLKPPDLTIPKDFSQPVVVASIYKGIEGVEESMAQAALDSTAAVEAVLVLSEMLSDSPWFHGLSIPTRVHFRDDTSHQILPFSWSTVEGLSAADNADLLISLEYIKIRPTFESYSYWDGVMNMFYGYLTMNVYAYWRVYDLTKKQIVADYIYRDTLTWDDRDYSRVRVGDQLPGFFSAATYSGFATGNEFAKRVAPSWMDEQRLFYTRGSKDLRKAAEFAQNNQWLDAAAIWQRIIRNPKSKPQAAARAAFNMALANELNGNFEVALEWLNKSKDFFHIPEETWYRRIIQLRIRVMEKI